MIFIRDYQALLRPPRQRHQGNQDHRRDIDRYPLFLRSERQHLPGRLSERPGGDIRLRNDR